MGQRRKYGIESVFAAPLRQDLLKHLTIVGGYRQIAGVQVARLQSGPLAVKPSAVHVITEGKHITGGTVIETADSVLFHATAELRSRAAHLLA